MKLEDIDKNLWIRIIAKGSYYYQCDRCGCKTNLIYCLQNEGTDLFLLCQECMDKRNKLLRDINNERN